MRAAPQAGDRLRTRTLALYALPNISISVVQLPLGIYLNDLYSTVMGVSLGLVGLAIFLSRVTDVITDPIIGSLSDNWRAPFGRRRFWVLLGTPLMIGALWLLFVPPQGVGVWWLFLMVSAVYLANTMIDLPYRAWGADLSTDYRERSRVTAWREICGLVGNVLAVAIPFAMAAGLGMRLITDWAFGIALATALLLPPLVLAMTVFVHEPTREELGRGRVDWWRGLRIVWRNGAFRRLAIMGFIFVVTIATTTATSLYFVDHVMGARTIYPTVLLAYFAASILAIPLWSWLAHRIGKHKAVAWAIVALAVGAGPMPFLTADDFALFVVFMLIKGAAIGALLFLPPSMAADVVDLDTLRSGRQRTGLYFALWGMIVKLAAGLALLSLVFVDWAGFDSACPSPANLAAWPARVAVQQVMVETRGAPEATVKAAMAEAAREAAALPPEAVAARVAAAGCAVNSPTALLVLALFYSVIPALLSLVALPFMWAYPITELRQKRLREAIARRNGRRHAPAAPADAP